MGNYSMELREFLDMEYGESIEQHMVRLREDIFNFPYPFYNELNRHDFEMDFIRYYYMREIGFETPMHFKMKLQLWLNINMPYWNELFKTEGLIKNPLINVDWTETRTTERDITTQQSEEISGKSNGNSTNIASGRSTQNEFNRNLESDTPDSRLQITNGDNGDGVIEYASRIVEDKAANSANSSTESEDTNSQTMSSESTGGGSSNDTYTDNFRVVGTQGMKTESEMLMLYRQTFLRIKHDIYKEMNVLFMLVY